MNEDGSLAITHNSNFTHNAVQELIDQLADRREKLRAFTQEAEHIEKVLEHLEKVFEPGALDGKSAKAEAPRKRVPYPERRDTILALLREKPNGLAGSRIAEQADIQPTHIYTLLARMQEEALIEKTHNGFWVVVRGTADDEAAA